MRPMRPVYSLFISTHIYILSFTRLNRSYIGRLGRNGRNTGIHPVPAVAAARSNTLDVRKNSPDFFAKSPVSQWVIVPAFTPFCVCPIQYFTTDTFAVVCRGVTFQQKRSRRIRVLPILFKHTFVIFRHSESPGSVQVSQAL